MEINSLKQMLIELTKFWRKQNILTSSKSKQEIEEFQKNNGLHLPDDFVEFYSQLNGMETLYPNETDEEGFLLYPLEAILPLSCEFQDSELKNKERYFLFAEYMQKSWWYGVEVINDKDYIIGIIPEKDFFKPITNSLTDFIKLYMDNSPKLYDY
ncbi:SMI1/KNR4 family protein [Chryseobacterium sp. L7]|uniref:SMI1/KNR4 family protein n=1 Tax=Chryseobacterium endalhagicum TaxID=2797638 RepID=A0ABS1QHF5_9FLAO|nr:SMI1/KNR4 family protein [Chryseobacterium endalhagicum]MBL1222030.1 SMI1/KNR4 family protein [Chryseobacterium endalhagicum]